MSRNFYLKRKILNPNLDTLASLGCGEKNPMIKQVYNGYIYGDIRYLDIHSITEGIQTIHIGKSVFGWYFLLCIYPDYGINTYQDWQELFNQPDNIIVDDKGKIYSPKEMCFCIADRRNGMLEQCNNDIEEYEKQCVKSTASMFNDCGMDIQSYDDLLALENAVRGERGLLSKRPNGKIIRGEQTFDYVICNPEDKIF